VKVNCTIRTSTVDTHNLCVSGKVGLI